MQILVTNNLTGKTEKVEMPDVEIPVIEETSISTIEDRITALEGTTEEIVETLNDRGLIP